MGDLTVKPLPTHAPALSADAEFFPGTTWRSNFLCNIGYGSDENLFGRAIEAGVGRRVDLSGG